MELLLLILVGIVGGLIAGSMGVGGGIIFTPVLYFLFDEAEVENAVQWSVASGLLCTFTAALSSTIRQGIRKNLYIKEGIFLGIFGAIGISGGKIILTSGFYQREQFAVLFSVVLFYAAYMMFKRGRNQKEDSANGQPFGTQGSLVTGLVGGTIASLAGVGGGGVMVPMMNLIYKQPFKKAVSISHLGMTLMILAGLAQLAQIDVTESGLSPYHLGYIDVGAALPLAVGGLGGAYFGTILNHKIEPKFLQWGFALLATVMAFRLLWSVFA